MSVSSGSHVSSVSEIIYIILKSRKGVLGLAIVISYLVLGFLGPTYLIDPEATSQQVADTLAVPEWFTFFNPNIPVNQEYIYSGWRLVAVEREGRLEIDTGEDIIKVSGGGRGVFIVESVDRFIYTKDPPRSILATVNYTIDLRGDTSPGYSVTYYLYNRDLEGSFRNITQGDTYYIVPRWYYIYYRDPPFSVLNTQQFEHTNKSIETSIRLPYHMINSFQPYKIPIYVNPVSELIFSKDTAISIRINITYICEPAARCEDAEAVFRLGDVRIRVYGLAYGVMGTDHAGRDVFAQFLLGARVANIFGVSAAIVIVFFGILLGSIAGYRGGSKLDHLVSFITDMTFMLPGLPLLIAASLFFGRSTLVIYIVIIMLSWPVIARLSRSWALALRNEQYVEAAIALGAGSGRIIRKHIIPAMVPLIVYGVVIEVPTVIFNEVLVQLLGFGDPTFPSWGRMLNQAYYEGALVNGAWWWILPPLTGVVSFTLGFVLIGLALDEYVNPKYRFEKAVESKRT